MSTVMTVKISGEQALMYHNKPLFLQNVMFCPALTWCVKAWMARGITSYLLLCEEQWEEMAKAAFPEGAFVERIDESMYEEHKKALTKDGLTVEETMEPTLPLGNLMISYHTMEELNQLQSACHDATIHHHELRGIRIMDPGSTYIDPRVTIGEGTILLPNTIIRGACTIGEDCEIGPNVMLSGVTIGNGCIITEAHIHDSVIEEGSDVGPYTHIRPGCHVGRGSHIGAFVQLKNCNLGEGTKMSHLTYVGDADVGKGVNFGCGTITSNYDGFKKHRTVIGDNAFIGCNTNLIAPVAVGEGAYVAAGSTVTKDVPGDALCIARARQENKEGWAERNRSLRKK